MSQQESMVSSLTAESIERLYWANDLRNYLDAHVEAVMTLGVIEVVIYGNVVRGRAKTSSDLDVLFVLGSESLDSSQSALPRWQRTKLSYEFVHEFVKSRSINKLEPYGEKPIHLVINLPEEGKYPRFVNDKIILWSANK